MRKKTQKLTDRLLEYGKITLHLNNYSIDDEHVYEMVAIIEKQLAIKNRTAIINCKAEKITLSLN